MFILRSRRAAAALGFVATLAITGLAVGYFTAGGSGSGSTQVGTGSGLQIGSTITPGSGGLVPGGNPADVTFTVTNPGSSNQYINTISLTSVTAYADAAHTTNITGTGAGKCDTTQFSMAAVSETQTIASGASVPMARAGSLLFNDSGGNQDGCKSAYLVLQFTSS